MSLFALWSFASPWLLLWGVTAALPVLIHLWSRKRYFETPWAATQFLLAAIRRHQRRIQIEQWLLLAIRVLILLLLAIALAEPVLSGLAGVIDPMRRPPTHTVLVIDTSYSMNYEVSGSTRLSLARSQAAKLVEDAAPGDAFSLVTLADPPEVIIGEASTSHSAVLTEVGQLKLTNRGANLAATLEQVERLTSAAEKQFDVQRIHFFSDLGKTTWSDRASNWRGPLIALSQRIACQLHPIGIDVQPDNAAITRLAVPSGSVNIGIPISIAIDVENFSNRQQLRKRIELVVDGQAIGEQLVDLEPSGQATAFFSMTLNVAGDHLLKASVGDDALPVDNTRWLSVSVRKATRVLCVQGRPHAAEYVALALESQEGPGGVVAEVASEHAIIERALHDYDCLFLCNVARFTPEEAKRLREYVEQGGGLVFVLGDLVQADSYNEQIGPGSPMALLPAKLNQVVSDGRHTFDPLEYRHTLTQPFRGHERAGLLTVPTWRYFHLDQVMEPASVVLAFDNGDPAIVEGAAGQGRVWLVATAASPESVDRTTDPPTPWTAFASWPSFPPLMHEIVRNAANHRATQRNVYVGEIFTLPATTSATGTMTRPDNSQTPLRFDNAERHSTYGQTDDAGAYRLAFDETTPPALFTANLRTEESNLESVPLESIASIFDDATPREIATPGLISRDLPLFRLALGGLLLLLVAETLLACHFGRATR